MSAASKVAVITGATSGIGLALCERLVADGWRVAGIGRDAQKLARVAERLGERFCAFTCDLANASARADLREQLARSFDVIDVLVSNAAEVAYAAPTELAQERWAPLFELNLLAAIDLTRGLASRMRRGSHIVNTSSVTARFLPNAKFAPYAMTKVALEELTKALRIELDPRGVAVTLVVPGLVDTPIYDKVEGFDRAREKLREQVPQWLSPADVADAIAWTIARPPHVVVSELVLMPRGQPR